MSEMSKTRIRFYPRSKLPTYLYLISALLSVLLFYWSGIYCSVHRCTSPNSIEYSRHLIQYFSILAAPLILFSSIFWLVNALFYHSNPCIYGYNYMEMPSAVFSSLLSGICAVIEIHFSVIEMHELDWNDKWCWAAADAVVLCGVHALVAFTLQ